MNSSLDALKARLDTANELGANDLKEHVDKIPFFVVCQHCGRKRPIEIPVCNHCERQRGNAIGFFTEE